jgi:hypothetical protein
MKISIVNTGLSPSVVQHAETRAWLATQRFQERVSWLTISLRKVQGIGAICRMEAWISGVGTVVGKHQDQDPVACVEVAAARLKHSAMRRLKARWQTPRRWKARTGGRYRIQPTAMAGVGW